MYLRRNTPRPEAATGGFCRNFSWSILSRLKHFCAFVLLAVFLYHLVGVYPVAVWQQQQFRREAEVRRRASLPAAALVRIAVARQPTRATGLVWHESDEFSYRGRLFDVVRQQTGRDSTIYLCWPDRGEEQLLASLAQHVREYAHPNAETRKSAKKAFDFLFKFHFLLPASPRPPSVVSRFLKPRYPAYVAVPCRRPNTPPFAPPRPGSGTRA